MVSKRLLKRPKRGSKHRLNLLMITPFYDDGGGVGTVSRSLTRKLRQKSVLVEVLLWWPGFNDPVFIDHRGRRTRMASLDDLLQSDRHYDVLHFQSAAFSDRLNGGFSKIVARFKAASVYTVHSLAAYHGEAMGTLASMGPHMQDQTHFMRHTDRTILLTEDLVDIAARHHGAWAHKFQVVHNGVDPPPRMGGTESLKKSSTLGNREKVLLYLGRISREKGIHELIEAFPRIKAAFPRTKLVIAGNKPGDTTVEGFRQSLTAAGLAEGRDYLFAGWVEPDQRERLFQIADFVIQPSYYEHMPLVALEAMIRRKPVIITRLESLTRVFKLDRAKPSVWAIERPKSVDAIVDSVAQAMAHPARVRNMVRRARRQVLHQFTWDRIAVRYLALYRDLIQARKKESERARAAFEREFRSEFDSRFQSLFEASFEGKMALEMGDYGRSISLLEGVLAANPYNDEVRGWLVEAFREKIVAVRRTLEAEPYCETKIAEIRELAERLQRLLVNGAARGSEIAVVMPVYLNRTHEAGLAYLHEAVESVLRQEFNDPYELVIVDDASELDVAGAISRRFGPYLEDIRDEDGRTLFQNRRCDRVSIRLIQRRQNSGNDVTPRNMGLVDSLMHGSKYLTHLDSDDRMLPDRLKTAHRHLERRPNTDFVHARQRCIDEGGTVVTGSQIDGWFNFHRKFTFGMDQLDPDNEGKSLRHRRDELELLMKDNWIHGGTVMYRSDILLRVGLENLEPTIRYGADHVFWQKVSRVATIDYLSRVIAEHRIHPGSMTLGGR